MRTLLFTILLVGCGTSDPRTWENCDLTHCSTDPSATWDVIADGAEVSGDYDVVGPPDPYLCLTVASHAWCSSSISDSSSPRWNDTILRSATVDELTTGPLDVNLWDQDTGGLDTNDFICGTSISITTDDLRAGGIRFNCGSGTSAEFRFHFVQ